jgi:pimeloyl-ACP methyl ester carboxylesterase
LHALLTNAGLPGPYVLVGHSAGGMHTQVYAGQYPADVAGLVLVDPTPAQAILRFSSEQRRAVLPDSGQIQLLKVMQFFGLLRFPPLSGNSVLASLPPEVQAQIRAHRLKSGAVAAMAAEADSLEMSISQTAVATPLPGDRHLLIVWHGIPAEHDELEALARASMEELVQQSGNSKFVVAEKSGHFITFERPDVVIEATVMSWSLGRCDG